MASAPTVSHGAAAAIDRVVIRGNKRDVPASAARVLVKWRLDDQDQKRMHELAVKNQQGELSKDDHAELQGFIYAGLVLDLIQANARGSLKRSKTHR
jgi:hypothetical protein